MSREKIFSSIIPEKKYTLEELREITGISKPNICKGIKLIEKSNDYIVKREINKERCIEYSFLNID